MTKDSAMEAHVLEQGLKNQLPAVEGFLKTILLKKINVEVSATSVADSEMVIEALKTGTAVVSVKDQIFNTSVFIAFDDNWIPQLSNAMLGVEEREVNEITRDLIKEFTSQLFGTIQVSLQADEIPVEPGPVDILKSAQIASGVTGESYFIAQIDVTGKFTIDGDEQPQLAMIVAFEIPDEDTIREVMGGDEEPVLKAMMEDMPTDLASDDDIEAAFNTAPSTKSEPATQKQAATPKKDKDREKAKDLPPVSSKPVEFEDFNPFTDIKSEVEVRNLDILKDVELDISVELGRKELPLGDVLHLVRGSVIELDKLAGEPVEIYANGHRIAEGEVVVIDEHFGVRITNLVSTKERIESLR
jgi:flagellar motor switch protein FliN/FliY